jgi:hypothetical protein
MTNYAFLDTDVEFCLLALRDNKNIVNQIIPFAPQKFLLLPSVLQELTQKVKNELGNTTAKRVVSDYLNDPSYDFHNLGLDNYTHATNILEDSTCPVEITKRYDSQGNVIKSDNGRTKTFFKYKGITIFKALSLSQLQKFKRSIEDTQDTLQCFSFSDQFIDIAKSMDIKAKLLFLS